MTRKEWLDILASMDNPAMSVIGEALVQELKTRPPTLPNKLKETLAELKAEEESCTHLAEENKNGSRSWWLARKSGLEYSIKILLDTLSKQLL